MSYAATASTSADAIARPSDGSVGTLKRVVLVTIHGTPGSLDSLGGDTGSWTLGQDQAIKIFTRSPNLHPDVALNEIKNVMLRRARMLEYKTNAPDVCGMYIEGLPGNEYTQGGEDHHIFMLGKGHSTTPQDIFVAAGDTELGMQWMQEYPHFNKENIRAKDVMRLHGADYYFVHENHPVINLLYNNQEALGTRIDPNDKVNGNWYRVNLQVFDDSCHTLDTQVFSRTPQVFDLTKLRVKIRRPDNKRWVDTPLLHEKLMELADATSKKEAYKKYMDKPLYFVARVEFEYAPPPEGLASSCAAASYTNSNVPVSSAPMSVVPTHAIASSSTGATM